jgi:hydroxymethylbilane synthase
VSEPLRLGTRGSRLARTQSEMVAGLIRTHAPGVDIELVEIRTLGDVNTSDPLGPALGQSFFTKEIEDALLAGRIDLAVHSCKDLATRMPDGLCLGAIPDREDPRDALVSRAGGLLDLPPGARVATSSMRRKAFLALARPDLSIRDQRGNVPTRVRAVDTGEQDAVVLAAAGLRRLGMDDRITETLDTATMLPAAAQGALAVQVRADDEATRELVAPLDHAATRAAVSAERACLRRLGAGCQAPVGALASLVDGTLRLEVAVIGPEGLQRLRTDGPPDRAEEVGVRAAEQLLAELTLESLAGATWAGMPPRRGVGQT